MAGEPTGGGNPNAFTVFKSRGTLVPGSGAAFTSDVVMLSVVNDVQIIGDATLEGYTAGAAFATLPEECRPATDVKVPVAVMGMTEELAVMTVAPSGECSLPIDYPAATVYLSGINFNVSDRWY